MLRASEYVAINYVVRSDFFKFLSQSKKTNLG